MSFEGKNPKEGGCGGRWSALASNSSSGKGAAIKKNNGEGRLRTASKSFLGVYSLEGGGTGEFKYPQFVRS